MGNRNQFLFIRTKLHFLLRTTGAACVMVSIFILSSVIALTLLCYSAGKNKILIKGLSYKNGSMSIANPKQEKINALQTLAKMKTMHAIGAV